ncbi:MAG: hypothetical protein DMD81_10635 [Candidatus Rokuibacteriota bacterium]|nr:MAG: hypothetical protein DMD81_10635 [Candidatus Rokubacteria bacterium]
MSFTPVLPRDDLRDGDMRSVHVDGRGVLIVRFNGEVYAYEDRCAHQGVPLSEGTLHGYVLACRAHEWLFDVRNGQGINPALAFLRRFPVKIEDGQVLVDVGAPAA